MANVSLTRDEAVRRAALVRVTGYDIELGLSEAETFRSRTVIGFTCATPGAATFVELADAIDVRARLNGAALPADAFEGNRIVLGDLAADNELVVEARLPCVTTGDGMNRYVDPADGATYLTAFCGMDLAQRVFACFDQPDLRAPISLSVVAPAGWTVLANGRAELTDEVRGAWMVAVRDHTGHLDVPLRGVRRTVALGGLGARHPGGRHPVRLAREAFDGPRPRLCRRRAEADHRRLLRPLHDDLRRAFRVRLLRPGDGTRD